MAPFMHLTADGRAPDRAPGPMSRPSAGQAAQQPDAREAFPSSVELREMNRQAAAEAFSGHAPRMMLALAVSIALATAGVLLTIRLHDLDLQLAARLV